MQMQDIWLPVQHNLKAEIKHLEGNISQSAPSEMQALSSMWCAQHLSITTIHYTLLLKIPSAHKQFLINEHSWETHLNMHILFSLTCTVQIQQ